MDFVVLVNKKNQFYLLLVETESTHFKNCSVQEYLVKQINNKIYSFTDNYFFIACARTRYAVVAGS